jgi:hypothetical protein
MSCLGAATSAKLAQLQPLRVILFIFATNIIALFADCAGERNHNAIFFSFGCHTVPPAALYPILPGMSSEK